MTWTYVALLVIAAVNGLHGVLTDDTGSLLVAILTVLFAREQRAIGGDR